MIHPKVRNRSCTARQLGLVYQRRVEDLVVLVEGGGGPLSYLLANLVLLGVGRKNGGILLRSGKSTVEERDIPGQFLLMSEDVGKEFDLAPCLNACDRSTRKLVSILPRKWETLARHKLLVPAHGSGGASEVTTGKTPAIWGQASRWAIYVGDQSVQMPAAGSSILTPCLNSLCGAVLAQELLRQTRCLRQITTAKAWVGINYVMRSPGIARAFGQNEIPSGLQFRSPQGVPLRAFPEFLHDDRGLLVEDEIILRVPLPDDDRAARLLADSGWICSKTCNR